MMTFDEALAYLDSLAPRGWRMGLDRMEEFVRRAQLESAVRGSLAPRFLHVAGTNGKGSVTAFLESIVAAHGVRVGGYYSPYVFDPCERITVGREKIDRATFASRIETLIPAGESLVDTEFGGVTEFEVKTAAGLLHWREERCEWVALEVGLGGRLDATNVVEGTVASIVSIGLDHTNILGDTIEAIAHEKAGIIKALRPVVSGEMSEPALSVIAEEARRRRAPHWRYGKEYGLEPSGSDEWTVWSQGHRLSGLRPGLRGARAPHNLAVAIASLVAAEFPLDEDAVREGAAAATLPGRMQSSEWEGVEVLLDGAHNRDAAQTLAEGLAMRYPGRKVALVLAMTRGHAPNEFVRPLLAQVGTVHLAPIDFHRALPMREVGSALPDLHPKEHASVAEALTAAAQDAGREGLVVVTGSFYLVGEAGAILGLTPIRAPQR
ncbi:MAG: bifunctional folylpolyglutamate synthase/dihydrofolate synthase [Fimbriimonadaceae bacterium]|nr:bifunctional folylpolyglutamate synthase/dihydrofolate synthase [Chthonomonadaceae bacterium]MCO5295311.1 bifunctional folylpolyglutamate synthase/dihydrofolate synthase [Fimbriimonadaceae bacterium]